jgi:hypothetical protein
MKVSVFQDSPKWSEVDRWFKLTLEELEALHVATYRLPEDEDGDPIRLEETIAAIKARHPGCVYLY